MYAIIAATNEIYIFLYVCNSIDFFRLLIATQLEPKMHCNYIPVSSESVTARKS